MEFGISVFIGLWFALTGGVSAFFLMKDFKEKRK